MLALWPNWWDDWKLEHKVSFSGAEKIIYLHPNITTIDVKDDIYSAWGEWVALRNNNTFSTSIRQIGGDVITPIISLGFTFFLTNGWKIRPAEENYILEIIGNLYSDDGLSPIIPTLGNYSTVITMTRSNLIYTISTGGLLADERDKLMGLPTLSEIRDEIDEIINSDVSVELSSIPAVTAPLSQQIQFLFQYFKNKRTVTSSQEKMYKENNTLIGTSTLSDDGTTFTKGKIA